MIKLFTFATSPYARKARMVLDYKQIPYESVERCYSLDRKEDLKAAYDRAEVPAIVLEDGQIIGDSTIICEFLEEAFPKPALMPRDPKQRARMRKIEDLCDRSFDAAIFGYFLAVVRNAEPEAEQMRLAARNELTKLAKRLERELGTNQFFCGDISVADIAVVP